MAESRSPSIYPWAVATVIVTFLLILAGALVTSRDAGLAVPDWPLAYGQLNPPHWYLIENVRTEHGHRIIALGVALLTTVLALRVYRYELQRMVRRLALAAVLLVLAQALLGGLRVLWLSRDLAMLHGCVAQIFLCVVVAIATLTSPRWPSLATQRSVPRAVSRSSVGIVGIVMAQLIVGIVIRHLGPGARPLLHNPVLYMHVTLAVVLLALLIWIRGALRDSAVAVSRQLRRRVDALLGLTSVQVMLGIATFSVTETMRHDRQATELESWIPTLHVLLGALILAAAVAACLHAIAWRADSVTIAPEVARAK